MDSNDLIYLFKNSNFKAPNIYGEKNISSTMGIHTYYLKNSNFKYKSVLNKSTNRRDLFLYRADGNRAGIIDGVSYSSNAKLGKYLVNDKYLTEKHLQNYKINTPNSKIYNREEVRRAYEETFSDSSTPVVIKPLISTQAKGVMVNISKEHFIEKWEEVCDPINGKSRKIMVQNFLPGFEARATIVHGQLVCIMARIPPYVVGNGVDNIRNLIDKRNEERSKCGYLGKRLLKNLDPIEHFLSMNSLSLGDIPKNEEYVLLSSISNVSSGGNELMNITNLVSNEITETALDALASIPGLYTGGVDLIMESFNDKNPTVIEINSFPGLSNTRFPTYGERTDPAKIFHESFHAMDQFNHNPSLQYRVNNEVEHLRHYTRFNERKQQLLIKNYRRLYPTLK